MAWVPDNSQQRPVVITLFTLTSLGTICTALRLYAIHQRKARLFNWDFFWIVLSFIFALASGVPLLVALHNGLGRHTADLRWEQVEAVIEYEWIAISVGITACLFGKLAIIALLLDIQGTLIRFGRHLMYFVATVLVLSWMSVIIVSWVQCIPIQKTWNILLPGTCEGESYSMYLSYVNGAINIAVDIFLSLYPILIMWNLKLKTKTKVVTCLLMAGGAFASFACIVRTRLAKLMWDKITDATYTFGEFAIYALLEMWLIIILGSLPSLRPLLLQWFGNKNRTDNKGLMSLPRWNGPRGSGPHNTAVDGFQTEKEDAEKSTGQNSIASIRFREGQELDHLVV
ncbi:hypothetical protein K461DRAFT_294493 [Myriangium duriaei CBS 260.36]|uniref:Rhodopsin domain-containing protein n=1 Tax=Myriangium duriaei CBS 260.36 TaxID=1168546 RepID=A0A9P4MJ01_9PEZI|nr:hypothetical protein K461DRAFT_294493 [Myriangium duriaei CBS 260.36]